MNLSLRQVSIAGLRSAGPGFQVGATSALSEAVDSVVLSPVGR